MDGFSFLFLCSLGALCVIGVVLLNRIAGFCDNPFKVDMVVGSKGSGKSLFMARRCNEHVGNIYSNMGIGFDLPEDYWNYHYPDDSLLVIDEIGVLHSNRSFKSFPLECMEFYKMARKNHLNILISSQTMDVDKKIRDLCDTIYVAQRFYIWTVVKPYKACIALVENKEGGHDLINDISKAGHAHWYTIPKSVRITDKCGYRTEQLITKTESTMCSKQVDNSKSYWPHMQ